VSALSDPFGHPASALADPVPAPPSAADGPGFLIPPLIWGQANLGTAGGTPRPWQWQGYLAPGALALLTGQWKAGKTPPETGPPQGALRFPRLEIAISLRRVSFQAAQRP
jgi:hypothetical protein